MDLIEEELVRKGHHFVQNVVVAQVRLVDYLLTKVRIYLGPDGVYLRYEVRRTAGGDSAECGLLRFPTLYDVNAYLSELSHPADYYEDPIPLIE